jgi:hypothetical protein
LKVCSSMPHLISPSSHGKHLASASWNIVWDTYMVTKNKLWRCQANFNDYIDGNRDTWVSACNFQTQERFPVKEEQTLAASDAY